MTTGRFDPGKLVDFFTWFDKTNQDHIDEIKLLQEECEALDPDMMSDFAQWVRMYRSKTAPETSLKFTPFLFQQLTGYAANKFGPEFCHDCAHLFEVTGFAKPENLEAAQMLMANLLHESVGFKYMKEIASGEAYNNRSDLGNGPNDGPKFKGCGPLQVTGRYHFTKFYEWMRDDEGIDDPNILRLGTSYVADKYPFSIAINWINRNNLLKICLEEGFDSCCYRINGGWNGYQDRIKRYDTCRKYMV